MAAAMLERDDLSVYIIGGVPRSFKAKLQKFVEKEAKKDGEIMLVDPGMTDWILSKLRDEKRPSKDRTPASQALWRAFSALSAARYHLQDQSANEERVRELRRHVEDMWREMSPMFDDDEFTDLENGENGEDEEDDSDE